MSELEASVGGIVGEIDARLDRRDVVRVLELGCGFGMALLDLRERYGERVEVFGINRVPHDGGIDSMMLGLRDRERTRNEASIGDLPEIVYADVSGRLPFEDESFDVVFSQVAWLYFSNKIAVIREVMRVLRTDGVAKIDADELRTGLPPEYARLVEIWDNGGIVPLGEYVRRYDGMLEKTREGEYLRFGKRLAFGENLERVAEIDLSAIHSHWDGVKCVYRLLPVEGPRTATPEGNDRST